MEFLLFSFTFKGSSVTWFDLQSYILNRSNWEQIWLEEDAELGKHWSASGRWWAIPLVLLLNPLHLLSCFYLNPNFLEFLLLIFTTHPTEVKRTEWMSSCVGVWPSAGWTNLYVCLFFYHILERAKARDLTYSPKDPLLILIINSWSLVLFNLIFSSSYLEVRA